MSTIIVTSLYCSPHQLFQITASVILIDEETSSERFRDSSKVTQLVSSGTPVLSLSSFPMTTFSARLSQGIPACPRNVNPHLAPNALLPAFVLLSCGHDVSLSKEAEAPDAACPHAARSSVSQAGARGVRRRPSLLPRPPRSLPPACLPETYRPTQRLRGERLLFLRGLLLPASGQYGICPWHRKTFNCRLHGLLSKLRSLPGSTPAPFGSPETRGLSFSGRGQSQACGSDRGLLWGRRRGRRTGTGQGQVCRHGPFPRRAPSLTGGTEPLP